MDSVIAVEYIKSRMNDLGFGKEYYIRYQHYVLMPFETVEIDAHNQFFILIGESSNVSILSDFGSYDLSDPLMNQQYHEHQGNITLANYTPAETHIKFIQIIPKN